MYELGPPDRRGFFDGLMFALLALVVLAATVIFWSFMFGLLAAIVVEAWNAGWGIVR